MICEKCGKEYDKSFGSGRFCSRSCANTRIQTKETKDKIRQSLIKEKKHCKLCNVIIGNRNKTGYCVNCFHNSKECENLRSSIGKNASSKVKNYRTKIDPIYKEHIPIENKMKYVYKEHNDIEISKWLNYLKSLNVKIPEYKVRQSQGYYVLTSSHKHTKGTHFEFEHNYIIQHILDNYKETNTVHHIDNNGLNNNIDNLLVFETNSDHIRFHHSKYAWLVYNEDTHIFTTILKK